jgi:protein TonB
VWFYIDEQGRVLKTQLNRTSGRAELDEAALRVANLMRFSPARNRDQAVKVWVQIPIRFQSTAAARAVVQADTPRLPPRPRPARRVATARAVDIAAGPTFTPMTRRPALKNPAEVARALEQEYPPLLREAGIGGTAVVWFFIDPDGDVEKTQLNQTSGHAALDEAAARVASSMKFSPAENRGEPVSVWVQIPIRFAAK